MRTIAICLAIVLGAGCAAGLARADDSPYGIFMHGEGNHEPSSARLGVSGPQLDDHTSKQDAKGMFLYIGIVWLLCPVVILAMLSSKELRPLGVILLVAYAFFIIPRIIEGIALFVFLPAMAFVGVIRGIFRQFK